VLAWMEAMTALAQTLMCGLAVGLGLDERWFADHLTGEPTTLFRVFRYPPAGEAEPGWGVGEHTDYGLLTILRQDDRGGLEVRGRQGWIAVPPKPDTFVCNIGDMLDRLTEGRYRSTPHRVRNTSGRDRLSFPFFFDPAWDAHVTPLPLDGQPPADDAHERWDAASVHAWEGPYGEYLTAKVAKVFPTLFTST
jgi:isopenicillin N synthase-like dioxygenase